MSKDEIVSILREEFDSEIRPYFLERRLNAIYSKSEKKGVFRKENKINREIETHSAWSGRKYYIICFCSKARHLDVFYTEFELDGNSYFAFFSDEGRVTVFSAHSLDRYRERVLAKEHSYKDIVQNYLCLEMAYTYHIVLPSPTHPYSVYYSLANGLFIGDYIIDTKSRFIWLNTCLGVKNLFNSEFKIFRSLARICSVVRRIKLDPFELQGPITDEKRRYWGYFTKDEDHLKDCEDFLRIKYLFCLLLLDIDYDIYPIEDINSLLSVLREEMDKLSIDYHSWSPYDANYGIAYKGELNYNPKRI